MIELNEKYEPLFTSDKRYFIVIGGRGSGKSFGVSTWDVLKSYERGHRTLYTRYTLTSAEKSIIPEYKEKIEILNKESHFNINKTNIQNNLTESDIIFAGIRTSSGNQTANLKSIQGVTTWILDEAEELVNEETFDKIDESIRTKGKQNRVVFVLNPCYKSHFIYKKFFKGYEKYINIEGFDIETTTHPDVCCIHTSYLDNLDNLDEGWLKKAHALKLNNPEEYAHRFLGKWKNNSGRVIFKNWSIVDEIPSTVKQIPYGLDFGFHPDPTAMTGLYTQGDDLYVDEILYNNSLTNIVTPNPLQLSIQGELDKINFDKESLIISESAEPKSIAELKSHGYNIWATKKGPGSILSGIKMLLGKNIKITRRSKNIITEFENYKHRVDKDNNLLPEPMDEYNHAIDSIRYVLLMKDKLW